MTRASDFLSDFLGKFFKDGLPVALAGAIGALVVGQVNRPAPIVVQAPPAVIPQPTPVVPERVVEELKRDAEPRPVAAQAVPKSTPMERKSHTGAPERLAKPTARQVPEKKVVAVEALPVAAPAPPVVAAAPAAPLVVTPPPPPEPRATEWVGLLPLPTRVTGTVDRAVTDAPVPPMPVPEAGARM